MLDMIWCEIKLEITAEMADLVAEVLLEEGAGGVVHDDPEILKIREFGEDEIIDEQLKESIAPEYSLRAYFPVDDSLGERLILIKDRLREILGETVDLQLTQIKEDDWAHAWKAYYKPEKIGQIVIKPSWESYQSNPDELIIELDPGMAFGTGTHPTTRLCLQMMQQIIKEPISVLDIGTGSGILAVAAAKLGASEVVASDIDPLAVKIAMDNIERNAESQKVKTLESDLLKKHATQRYDLVVANIVADIILRLIPDLKGYLKITGSLLLSGIIQGRLTDVEKKLNDYGFQIVETVTEGEWRAVLASNNSEN